MNLKKLKPIPTTLQHFQKEIAKYDLTQKMKENQYPLTLHHKNQKWKHEWLKEVPKMLAWKMPLEETSNSEKHKSKIRKSKHEE